MPSLIGHAVVGYTSSRLPFLERYFPDSGRRKWLLALMILCCLIPDFDAVGLWWGIPYESLLGHRGFSHSLTFALLMGVFAAWIARRFQLLRPCHERWSVLGFTLLTASHLLLDAMTLGGHGVAVFSPWIETRYFFSFRPIVVSPLTLNEFLSLAGVRVLLSEALVIALPAWVLIVFSQRLKKVQLPRFFPQIMGAIFGVVGMSLVMSMIPEELISRWDQNVLFKVDSNLLKNQANQTIHLPLDELPGKKLLVNYKDLVRENLLNRELLPDHTPWSSGFFPFWLGGASGRWQSFEGMNFFRTWFGSSPLSSVGAVELLHQARVQPGGTQAQAIHRLSPTEKYDLAVGDYHLSATRAESRVRGHDLFRWYSDVPLWSGYCNGLSLASIYESEPKRPVQVINPDGYAVTFDPIDVKALLGVAYLNLEPANWDLGVRCNLDSLDSEDCRDLDPAALVIAITNLIGRAKTTFIIDQDPKSPVSNAPIRKALIRVMNPPYFTADRQPYFPVDDLNIKWLMDVEIQLEVSRIPALPYGALTETLTYPATLGLDASMNLIGGRWENPVHHPDFAWGGQSRRTRPKTVDGRLVENMNLQWPVIEKILAQSSVSEAQEKTPTSPTLPSPLFISTLPYTPVSHGMTFQAIGDRISGGVSWVSESKPFVAYGRIEGEDLKEFESVQWVASANPALGTPEQVLDLFFLPPHPGKGPHFFKLTRTRDLHPSTELKLRVIRKNPKQEPGYVEFQFKIKAPFDTPLRRHASKEARSQLTFLG
ncbi:MAG: metal-dependent hydrolase [Bdellovibrionia bacterium]